MDENHSENCIFCSIVSGKTPSGKIAEGRDFVSVLEINPISRGHMIIIPRKHASFGENVSGDMSKTIQDLSKRVMDNLSAKDVVIAKASLFGHDIINLIPKYTDEKPSSERHQASKEELDSVMKSLSETKRTIEKPDAKKEPAKKTGKIKKISSKNTWLPRRIP